MNVTGILEEAEMAMMNSEEAMRHDFAAIRTGKASPALVENIQAEYYGTKTRIKDIAGISTPEPRLIAIQPWDQSAVKAIEKAILESNIGISPVSDGRVIRLPIPPLTQDRRQTLGKQVKARAEEARVSIRGARRDANEAAKKAQKDGDITEDQRDEALDRIQKLTDSYIAKVEAVVADKEKELMAF